MAVIKGMETRRPRRTFVRQNAFDSFDRNRQRNFSRQDAFGSFYDNNEEANSGDDDYWLFSQEENSDFYPSHQQYDSTSNVNTEDNNSRDEDNVNDNAHGDHSENAGSHVEDVNEDMHRFSSSYWDLQNRKLEYVAGCNGLE